MLYLVHGDDIAKSRSLILAQQKKLDVEKRIEISPDNSQTAQIIETANNPDLFGVFPFLVVDISTASKNAVEDLQKNLGKINSNAVVIILSNKSVSGKNPIHSVIKGLGGRIIENNKVPDANIFKFIDTLFSKNRYLAYKEYEKLVKNETDPIYLVSMLEFGLRNCLLIDSGSSGENKMSPFVKSKSKKFTENFSPKVLRNLHSYIYETEKKLKTGGVSRDLAVPIIIEKVLNS